jgi:predicted ATPase/transcriptional regulator with XRE-family HTH domain
MTTSNRSLNDEDFHIYFSEWVKGRRQALDLTQAELAERASCSVFTLRKIEAGERRPSKQLAGILAEALGIASEDQATFVKVARGELGIEKLARLPCGPAPPGSSIHIPSNLPSTLTPFIGREPELAALRQLLCDPQCSLLTIVGSGGIGKTRLAIEAAHHSQDLFPDGVWFVPLAAVNSPALIVPGIADAVNFSFKDPSNPQELLLRYLSEKKALLILDNTEHLLDGVDLFAEILHACPHIKLLVTSRERLNLLSEWVIEILGLPVPPNDRVEQFESYSSIALFLQSARRVQAGFTIRKEDRSCILRICQIMEGMPLGIELSAAWVGLLSCQEIAKEIEHNLDFLSVTMRDLPERHRSLRATLDTSWQLLSIEEKAILSRLSVFHVSFSREAASEICGASLANLSSFRNKMLLYRTDQDYYSLHELIRQYAELKLKEDTNEFERVKDLHSSYYVRRLSEWEKALKSSRQVETLDEIAQMVDNLSRGWQHMVSSLRPATLKSGQFDRDVFHRSLFSLSLFYELRNRSIESIALFKESVAYLKSIQKEFEETEYLTDYYAILGHITAYLGLHHIYVFKDDQPRIYLEEAIELLGKGQSRVERAQAQVMLAAFYTAEGKLQKSANLLERSREVFQEEGDDWWYLLASINLTNPYSSLGKLQECESILEKASTRIEPGDFRLGFPLRSNLANVLNLRQDFGRAEALLQENLQLSYQYGTFYQTSHSLYGIGRIALATHQIDLAEKSIRQSIDLKKQSTKPYDISFQQIYLGKCLATRPDKHAARDQFRQVIKEGLTYDRSYLVYWSLTNIASTYMDEDQVEKALQIALALRHCSVEFVIIKEENDHLLSDLRARLPKAQFEAAMHQVDSSFIADPAGANALAYALEHDLE